MPPCLLFNVKNCPKPAGTCLNSHEPDEHSVAIVPGGPNYCKKDLLFRSNIGSRCETQAGRCCYRHTPLELHVSVLRVDAVMMNLIDAELRKRISNGESVSDLKWCLAKRQMNITARGVYTVAEYEEARDAVIAKSDDGETLEESEDENRATESESGKEGTETTGQEKASKSKSKARERMGNCGFTHSEVMELAEQGVKPWEEDARAVLAALRGIALDGYEIA